MYNLGFINCSGPYYTIIAAFLWSGLLLSSATIERFLSVAFPLRVKMWKLYSKSRVLMIIYIVVSFLLSSYSVLCLESVPSENDLKQCVPVAQYINICRVSDIIVNTVLSNSLRFSLIFLFTILTSIFLYKLREKRFEMGQDNDSSGKEFQITLMLVIVATLFLFLRLPEMIVFQLIS